MKFFKNKKGFTLVELVVVIAILGILAGIAIPRFMDATASARGAKIVADMRTIESAESMNYARNGAYAGLAALVTNGFLATAPVPPTGDAKIPETNKEVKGATAYTVNTTTGEVSITATTGGGTLSSLIKS